MLSPAQPAACRLRSLQPCWTATPVLTACLHGPLAEANAPLCCSAYDLEDKVVGTVGAGRIGRRVLQRLKVTLCCAALQASAINTLHCKSLWAHRSAMTLLSCW